MKLLKTHWPVLLMLVAIIICTYEWVANAASDTGGVIVFYIVGFGLILPVCSFILSLWYGYIFRCTKKWLIPVACAIPCIIMTLICGDYKIWENWAFDILSVFLGLIGMAIGNFIWKHRQQNIDK